MIRKKDKEELKNKDVNHEIMSCENKDEYELDKELYNKVLNRISKKRKENV